jgi:cytochrome P450
MALLSSGTGESLPRGPELDERQQTFAWFSRPYALLDACAARFGDRFTLSVGGWGTQVVVADPVAVRDVFLGAPDVLLAGEANAFLRPLFGSHSLLLLDGPAHRIERKRLLPAFHGERLHAYGRLIQGIVRRSSEAWPEATPFSMVDTMLGVSLEIILRAVFGVTDFGAGNVLAFGAREDGAPTESLVVVAELEVRHTGPLEAIRHEVRSRVRARTALSPLVVLVRPGTVQKTTSGKLRRLECRRRWERGELGLLDG